MFLATKDSEARGRVTHGSIALQDHRELLSPVFSPFAKTSGSCVTAHSATFRLTLS